MEVMNRLHLCICYVFGGTLNLACPSVFSTVTFELSGLTFWVMLNFTCIEGQGQTSKVWVIDLTAPFNCERNMEVWKQIMVSIRVSVCRAIGVFSIVL